MKIGSVKLSFGVGMGILLASVLGATPAAVAGMELAWLVVCFGLSALILAPWLACRQVLAIRRIEVPPRITVHAGKTAPLQARIVTKGTSRLVMLALARSIDPPSVSERAPRLMIAAMGSKPEGVDLELPLRIPLRGRSRGLRLWMSSSYPFGLVAATRFVHVDTQVTALPRLMPNRDLDTRRVLQQISIGEHEAKQRHLARGQGLPVSLREARPGDSVRDLHLRSSLRRGRWTAIERPRLTNDSATVTVCFPSGPGRNSRRGETAFEVAISVAASIVQAWTSRGLEVGLFSGTPQPHPSGLLDHRRHRLCVSQNALQHLHELADLSLDVSQGRGPIPVGPNPPLAALGALVIPVQSLLVRPECIRLGCEVQVTIWADGHGRILAEVSRGTAPRPSDDGSLRALPRESPRDSHRERVP